jgi:hypothetical protein
MIKKIILLYLLNTVNSYILPQTFKNWHCINFEKNIDKSKPYSYNIGELPLITWFDQNNLNKSFTTINICKHMGSLLDNGKVLNDCLICPYHNFKYTYNDTYGETIIYQNKLWWSFKPNNKLPPDTPLYNNNNFNNLLIEKDFNANIIDCMLNILDINYHKKLLFNIFNINLTLNNLKIVNYKNNNNKLGIKFNCNELNKLDIYYTFEYPYTSYYFIIFNNQKIIININLLPINNNKTRWFIDIKYINFKSFISKILIKIIIKIILNQNEKKINNISHNTIIKYFITYNFNKNNEIYNNSNNIFITFFYNIKQKYINYLFPDKYCIQNFIKNIKFY